MMKNIRTNSNKLATFLIFTLIFLMMFAMPSTVSAQTDDNGDKYVLGGRYRLREGDVINGNLFVFGGTAILEKGSAIYGDVVLIGGTLEVSGTIGGNVNAIGGTINLLDQAVVHGDLNLTSVSMNRSPNALVDGNINEGTFNFEGVEVGDIPKEFTAPTVPSPLNSGVDFIVNILWACVRILAVSTLAALVVLLIEKPTDRVRQSIVTQPGISSAFGVLTVIVAPALVLLLTITLILIPVALIGMFALAVAGLFGWVAIGYEVGLRIEKSLKQNWAPAISAGVGTFFLTLAGSLIGAIPCVGWIFPVIISIVGVGGVMISRFGTMVYTSVNGGTRNVSAPQYVKTQQQVEGQFKDEPEKKTGPETPDDQPGA